MGLKKRADDVFRAFGESFLINGVTEAKGFFQQLDQTRMNMYFDVIEQGSILRPALIALVPADTVVSTGDTITRDGRTYTVAKMSKQRVRDTVLSQTLLLT
jgi:hypothetical protein